MTNGAKQETVVVVISTYNGEKYLHEQIESVLHQTYANIKILVRDDGSTDDTVRILEEYQQRGLLKLVKGQNVGVTRSFFQGIKLAAKDAAYISLCDQDDVWHESKVEDAVLALRPFTNSGIPALYCSELNFCDEDLAFQKRSAFKRRDVCFSTQLYENMCSGNTMLLNAPLISLFLSHDQQGAYCHDWWISLIATALGELVYSDVPSLEYRRMGNNASPSGTTGIQLLSYRIKTFLGRKQVDCIREQLVAFWQYFGKELNDSDRRLLETVCFAPAWKKATVSTRLRQSVVDEIGVRALLLLGKL